MRVQGRPDGGSVVVASLPQVGPGKEAFRATTSRIRAYVEEDTAEVRPPKLTGMVDRKTRWTSARVDWRRVDAGDGWVIYDADLSRGPLPIASTLSDPRGRADFTALGAPDQIVRIYGTRHLLP